MEVMQFLSDYGFQLVVLGLSVTAFVVSLVRGNSISKAVKDFEEVNNLKYKTTATAQKAALKNGQVFSEEVSAYVLNRETNNLEKLETPVNIQKKIDSYVETCLERSLERFNPKVTSETDQIIEEYDNMSDDLAVMGEAFDLAEEYRERFGLPLEMSVKDIYAEVGNRSDKLKARLSELNKGGNKDEKNETPQNT